MKKTFQALDAQLCDTLEQAMHNRPETFVRPRPSVSPITAGQSAEQQPARKAPEVVSSALRSAGRQLSERTAGVEEVSGHCPPSNPDLPDSTSE
jgi:hypothetical protein